MVLLPITLFQIDYLEAVTTAFMMNGVIVTEAKGGVLLGMSNPLLLDTGLGEEGQSY